MTDKRRVAPPAPRGVPNAAVLSYSRVPSSSAQASQDSRPQQDWPNAGSASTSSRAARTSAVASPVGPSVADGADVAMNRGFHAFFRQYYNLRALLRRVDPSWRC